MRKQILRLLLGLILVSLLNSCNRDAGTIHISGYISGAGSTDLYIGEVGDYFMNIDIIDTIECIDDAFSHDLQFGKNDHLHCFMVNGRYLYFLPDSDSLSINGNIDNLIASSISGSESNFLLSEYWSKEISISKQAYPLYSELHSAQQEQNSKLEDSIRHKILSIDSIQVDFRNRFIQDNQSNNGSAIILFLNLSNYRSNLQELITLYSTLESNVKKSSTGIKVSTFISSLEACAIGKPYTDLELTDPENRMVKLSSFDGEYFFIDFWTTWCGPCRGEWPFLEKAYNQFKTRGFEIISVSLDNSRDAWINAIDEIEHPWTQLSICDSVKFETYFQPFESEAARSYAVLYVPSNYLIDRDGNIVASDLRGQELLDSLDAIFN